MVLGSGIRKKPIPDPGSRIQGSKSTRSRIRIRNTAKSVGNHKYFFLLKDDIFPTEVNEGNL
jgi:hypothetical protein